MYLYHIEYEGYRKKENQRAIQYGHGILSFRAEMIKLREIELINKCE